MATELTRRREISEELVLVHGRSERTTEAYRAVVVAFLEAGHPASVAGVREHIADLKRTKSASTVNQALAALRKAFSQAGTRLGLPERELAIMRGALAEISGMRKGSPEVSVISPEEREKLFVALPLRMRLIAETLYVTGARVSEILAVRRDEIRRNGAVELRLRGKGGKERTAKVPLDLYERILEEFPDGEFLFESQEGKHYHREYVSRELARAAKRVLGRSVSAHVLRHSRATDLLASTHRIKAVSRLLGHADEATTLRYYVHDAFTDEELFAGM